MVGVLPLPCVLKKRRLSSLTELLSLKETACAAVSPFLRVRAVAGGTPRHGIGSRGANGTL